MNKDNEIINSWIIRALRTTIGFSDVRVEILKHYLQHRYHDKVEYCKDTFTIGVPIENLCDYLDHVLNLINNSKDKILLFTCNNNVGITTEDNIETHYQTFVVYTKSKKIIMIDPSRERREIGIYSPHAAMFVFFYLSSRSKCDIKFNWLNLSSPCQIDYSKSHDDDDVFCQTWSLFLQLQVMLLDSDTIDIPNKLDEKYTILVDFYKEIMINVPFFKEELVKIWKGDKKEKTLGILDYDPDAKTISKSDKIKFKRLDIITMILEMTSSDFYNVKYKKKNIKKDKGRYVNQISENEINEFAYILSDYPSFFNSEDILNLHLCIEKYFYNNLNLSPKKPSPRSPSPKKPSPKKPSPRSPSPKKPSPSPMRRRSIHR